MKVFFTASQGGKKFFDKYYTKIYNLIEEFNHSHLDKTLITVTSDKFYKDLEEKGREANIDLYEKNLKCIKEAHVNVFECSSSSISIGFMIEKSIGLNKPTIVLFLKDHVPHFLAGMDEQKLIVKEYTEKNLAHILKVALEEARNRADKRFNFFISPYLLAYLQKVSKELGITKSTFIRNLILEHMKKNNIKV